MDPPFQAVVKILIRVQFWRIGRQVEHFNLLFVFLKPVCDHPTVVDLQVVEDQIHLPASILNKPSHKGNQALAVHGVLVEHEPDLALVGDGGDHIYPIFSAGLAKKRRLAFRGITLLNIRAGLDACFVDQ